MNIYVEILTERRVWNEKGRERGVSDMRFPGGNVIALWNVWGGLLGTRVSDTLGEASEGPVCREAEREMSF